MRLAQDIWMDRVSAIKIPDLTVFSFHPIKSITTGEGGVITTNNKKLYEKLKRLRSNGLKNWKETLFQKIYQTIIKVVRILKCKSLVTTTE